jgi:hypothetical protein
MEAEGFGIVEWGRTFGLGLPMTYQRRRSRALDPMRSNATVSYL